MNSIINVLVCYCYIFTFSEIEIKLKTKQLMYTIDINGIKKSMGSPSTIWLPTFFEISSFVFSRFGKLGWK